MINDKSQGSIAKHLRQDGLLYYKFITLFANEFFWGSYGQEYDTLFFDSRCSSHYTLICQTIVISEML